MENISESESIEKRKEKVFVFLKEKQHQIFYVVLALITFLGLFLRTRNISKLKDITTNTWTLGPDLDPFLFLRWAENIVENGKLMLVDYMRNVPLGFNTAGEMKLLAYLIAWFHNFLDIFSLTDSVTYSSILFPVMMFVLTTIAFFLFARKIFYRERKLIRNLVALLATLFFVLIPSLLPRTIAGIPEKESAAFFFMFIAFYFFLEAFTSKKLNKGIVFGILAGIMTGAMGLVWGGVVFVFLTISPAVLFAFILGKINKKRVIIYASWMIASFIVMMPFSTRYAFTNLVTSTSTGTATAVLIIILMSFLFRKSEKFEQLRKKTKLPKELFGVFCSVLVLAFFVLIFMGYGFISSNVQHIANNLVEPSESRFSFTVAENKQPYFLDHWAENFGPIIKNIPIFFWLFFIGSVFLFNHLIKNLRKKDRIILIFSYTIFLFAIIFSRYSASSVLNGLSGLSLLMYLGGAIIFLFAFFYVYFQKEKLNEFYLFKSFNFAYLLYFMVLTLGIVGARGAIRLIMVLGSVSPIAVSFLVVKTCEKWFKEKEETKKLVFAIIAIILILCSGITIYSYYSQDKSLAENFAPGPYQWQWQNAMSWVRENTPKNSVFAHWWDYGYWVQSIGKRATVLDGGNAIVYWNHLLGRHVLTGNDENKALEFLYTHNATHLLIDPTDIGKYTAFSSIGADENYDRFSWIDTFLVDESLTMEDKDTIGYIYTGMSVTDEDILWNENGEEIFLPKKNAVIGGIIITSQGENNFLQPKAVFVYNNQQYSIPLRYIYFEHSDKFVDFGSGLEAGVFLYPKVNHISGTEVNINYFGAALYLSSRTVNSQLAQLYLFNQESNYFKLANTETNLFIQNLRDNGVSINEFIYYNGLQGPIKIWEISYPSNIHSNPEFLETDYPNDELRLATPGEY